MLIKIFGISPLAEYLYSDSILSQLNTEDGKWHPVAFLSKSLSPVQRNYEVHDKELLAIVESFRDMQAWLIGMDPPISVISDHKNLEYFIMLRVLNHH